MLENIRLVTEECCVVRKVGISDKTTSIAKITIEIIKKPINPIGIHIHLKTFKQIEIMSTLNLKSYKLTMRLLMD